LGQAPEDFQVPERDKSQGRALLAQVAGRGIPTLEELPEQGVRAKGFDPLQGVRQDHSRTMGGVCGPEDNGSGIGRKCQVHGTGEEEHPSSSPGYAGKEAHFWKLEEDAQASRTYTMQGVVVHAGGIRC
jgi:hypothetical protein